jgi:hypothetical protein
MQALIKEYFINFFYHIKALKCFIFSLYTYIFLNKSLLYNY